MAVGAGLDTLEALYNELVNSMNQIDGMITSVDQKFGAARAEWKGQGEADFETQWAANHAMFPRGVDLLLGTPGHIVGLPRTTRATRSAAALQEA